METSGLRILLQAMWWERQQRSDFQSMNPSLQRGRVREKAGLIWEARTQLSAASGTCHNIIVLFIFLSLYVTLTVSVTSDTGFLVLVLT